MSRREGNDMIVLTIEDCTGRKLLRLKSPAGDENKVGEMFNSILEKYGMALTIVKQQHAPKTAEPFEW